MAGAYDPALGGAGVPPNQSFDYRSAIDPALEAANGAPSPYTQTIAGTPYSHYFSEGSEDTDGYNRDNSGMCENQDQYHLGGTTSRNSPSPLPVDPALLSVVASDVFVTHNHSILHGAYTSPGKINVDDLLNQAGEAPTITAGIINKMQDGAVLEEVKQLYHSIYAQGLESFLESKWFPTKGTTKLLSETKTLEQFIVLLEQFKKAQDTQDTTAMAYTSSVEARVVWALASMVRLAAADGSNGIVKPEHGYPSGDDATEAANRLAVFENLITGAVAPNVLSRQQPNSDPHRIRELEFWFQLGHFVSLHDNGSPQFAVDVDTTMTVLRGLLDGRENRDVLYSIVVVRALGPRVTEYSETEKPLHLDESDARSKLLVAKKFVKDEGSGAGTTNVIRRLCELATRSWEGTLSPPAPVS